MRDLVRILESYCATNSIEFRYGSEQHLNLLQGTLTYDQIYLLLFPVTRLTVQNADSIKVQGTRFTGRFMLVRGSDYANHYFNENQKDQATSKYTINIEPLLTTNRAIAEHLMCNESLIIDQHQCQDAVNVMDANKDGLWCTFNYRQFR